MKSNYKCIGQYVRQVKTRNKDLALSEPKGIKINKEFMPSVANTIGTDLSKYRVVSQDQFAYNPMHVGRDEALPISMLSQEKSIIVSPAYIVFEIIDKEELLPAYLMMWCRRPEFDRNAWFTTDSSVRGGFNWDDFCNMELPIIDIEAQREAVREYNVIVDRIKLNEQLCTKLEETAQAIYKQWFIDFEFPISKEYATKIGKTELEGKLYKSSGGEMKYCDVLEMDIPLFFEGFFYEAAIDFKTGKLNSNAAKENGEYPFFTCSAETFKTDTFSFECEAVLLAGNNASAIYPLKFFSGKFDAYQRTYVATTKYPRLSNHQIYLSLKTQLEGFKGTSSGTATKFLTMKILNILSLPLADDATAKIFKRIISPVFELKLHLEKQQEYLFGCYSIILSGMAMKDVAA